jgi:hypothetical protein
MRKLILAAPLLIGAAAIAVVALFAPARAQIIDPGIQAIVAALKGVLTVTAVPATGNGWTPFLANGLTTTVTTVKSSAGELGLYHCLNPNTVSAYVQIFDTSGAVTLGTTVPVLSLGIPASSSGPGGGNLEWTMGIHFANAIKVAVTTTATGSAAPSTALDCNFGFK